MITTKPDIGVPPTRFVPAGIDPADTDALTALVDTLLAREPASGEELSRWLEDWGELEAATSAAGARRFITMTCDTDNEAKREAHIAYERDVTPVWKKLEDRLVRRLLESPHRGDLPERFSMFEKKKATTAEIYREENLPLASRETELETRYNQLTGGLEVDLDGPLTMEQAGRLLERPDRALRERAWRAMHAARLGIRDDVEDLFDEILALRHEKASNADQPDYTTYRFKELCRFDYAAGDCLQFHDAVERTVGPAYARCMERRKARLGLDRLRPWDTSVATRDGEPQAAEDEAGLLQHTTDVFRAIDPAFAADFDILRRNGLLDVWTRPGKAPGGYNFGLLDIGLPFVFANAAGGRGDLRVMLHEGGHAFHTIATREMSALLGDSPIEFCEVASMAMELFGGEHLDAIYPESGARTVLAARLEEGLLSLAGIARIDAFQHWLYAHPGHDRSERKQAWIDLGERFLPGIDREGLETGYGWTGVMHIICLPFYYIDYALAWLGAVQVWQRFRQNPAEAIDNYRRALRLGGTQPLPALFEAAGARFGTDAELLGGVVVAMEQRLEELDELA